MTKASAVIIIKDGKVLILQRSDRASSFKGKWNFPGGTVESGESFISAAKRELKEEANLDVDEKDLKLFFHKTIANKLDIKFYVTQKYTGDVQINDESHHYKWVTYDELEGTDMIPLTPQLSKDIKQYMKEPK